MLRTDEHGVVLGAAGQNLDAAPHLIVPASVGSYTALMSSNALALHRPLNAGEVDSNTPAQGGPTQPAHLPITGSSLPSRAAWVRSRPYLVRASYLPSGFWSCTLQGGGGRSRRRRGLSG